MPADDLARTGVFGTSGIGGAIGKIQAIGLRNADLGLRIGLDINLFPIRIPQSEIPNQMGWTKVK